VEGGESAGRNQQEFSERRGGIVERLPWGLNKFGRLRASVSEKPKKSLQPQGRRKEGGGGKERGGSSEK